MVIFVRTNFNFFCSVRVFTCKCVKVKIKFPIRYSWKDGSIEVVVFDDKHINVQQVPEEIERVMVGIEAYLSIRRHVSDIGLSVFEDTDNTDKAHGEKVCFLCYFKSFCEYYLLVVLLFSCLSLKETWKLLRHREGVKCSLKDSVKPQQFKLVVKVIWERSN